ncbi:hypothetical protein LCGC14_2698900 [marine sediment metagenome]|uniref:Uncharacterized protein n=1 Tax=marine sediment metagenome TaxID=412755 RepID=A0A0F9BQN3_9ZZZZ
MEILLFIAAAVPESPVNPDWMIPWWAAAVVVGGMASAVTALWFGYRGQVKKTETSQIQTITAMNDNKTVAVAATQSNTELKNSVETLTKSVDGLTGKVDQLLQRQM